MKIEGKVGLYAYGQQDLCLFPHVYYEHLALLLMQRGLLTFVVVGFRPGALLGITFLEINMCLHFEGRLLHFSSVRLFSLLVPFASDYIA